MANGGYVKNWRSIKDWEWYRTPNMAHLFQHLIREANHEQKRWQGVQIERGQLVTSLPSLKKETGISVQSLRTCLDRLKSTGEITGISTNRFRIITICNYTHYQSKPNEDNSHINRQTNRQLTDKQQTTNSKQEGKEGKEGEEGRSIGKKRFVKPTPLEVSEYAKSIGYQLEGEYFCDTYEARGWMIGKNRMKDWKASVRTWKKNDYGNNRTNQSQTGITSSGNKAVRSQSQRNFDEQQSDYGQTVDV